MEIRRDKVLGHDAWTIDVLDLVPSGRALGVVVAGHAMMVDRRTVFREGRPCLGKTLVEAGFRVLVPDLRGHGASGPCAADGGRWSYDDIVDDVGALVAAARARANGAPITLLGHSLFGHAALAWLGRTGAPDLAAVVAIAVNIWNRRWTVGTTRWLAKRAVQVTTALPVAALGYAPVRRLRLGTADEAGAYWRQLNGFVASDTWGARDGFDYAAALATLALPVLHVLSQGDRLYASPADSRRFLAALGPCRQELLVGPSSEVPALRGLALDHMGLLTSPSAAPVWKEVATWLTGRTRRQAQPPHTWPG